jgi:hypothetical protein
MPVPVRTPALVIDPGEMSRQQDDPDSDKDDFTADSPVEAGEGGEVPKGEEGNKNDDASGDDGDKYAQRRFAESGEASVGEVPPPPHTHTHTALLPSPPFAITDTCIVFCKEITYFIKPPGSIEFISRVLNDIMYVPPLRAPPPPPSARTIMRIYARYRMFVMLDSEQREALRDAMVPKTFNPDEIIVREGCSFDHFCFCFRGLDKCFLP